MKSFESGDGEYMNSSCIFKYSCEQMKIDLQRMKQSYPGKISLDVAAFTADEREITEVVLGRPEAEHHILVQASMHGREYMNTALVMRQIEDYLNFLEPEKYREHYGKEFYGKVCFHVFPMVNPDGVTISQEGVDGIRDLGLRKAIWDCFRLDMENNGKKPSEAEIRRYFRRWKANARGVDLNRNFDAGWAEYKGTVHPSSEGFKGLFPGSEPEIAAILQTAAKYPLDACICYHSADNLVYWDYGSAGELYKAEKHLAEKVGAVTGYPLKSTVQSEADGAGCSDYFVQKLEIPAVTIENGVGPCPLEKWEFWEIYKRNRDLWACLAQWC